MVKITKTLIKQFSQVSCYFFFDPDILITVFVKSFNAYGKWRIISTYDCFLEALFEIELSFMIFSGSRCQEIATKQGYLLNWHVRVFPCKDSLEL
jgi:hypothetical protein